MFVFGLLGKNLDTSIPYIYRIYIYTHESHDTKPTGEQNVQTWPSRYPVQQPSRNQPVGSGGGLPLEWLGAMVHLQCVLRWRNENQDDGTFRPSGLSSRTPGVAWRFDQRFSVSFTTKIGENDPSWVIFSKWVETTKIGKVILSWRVAYFFKMGVGEVNHQPRRSGVIGRIDVTDLLLTLS